MQVDFSKRVQLPADVLVQVLDGEAVVLSMKNGHYFGLDVVATRMWQAATTSVDLTAACETLISEYDAQPQQLRRDLEQFIGQLVSRGLLEYS